MPITLDDFDAEFTEDASLAAKDFTAHVTVRDDEQAASSRRSRSTTRSRSAVPGLPRGNGFAPDVEVVDADGNVAFSGPVPFIPEDAVYTSRGVIKVPDVTSGDQIGLVGYLLPTAQMTEEAFARSTLTCATPCSCSPCGAATWASTPGSRRTSTSSTPMR